MSANDQAIHVLGNLFGQIAVQLAQTQTAVAQRDQQIAALTRRVQELEAAPVPAPAAGPGGHGDHVEPRRDHDRPDPFGSAEPGTST